MQVAQVLGNGVAVGHANIRPHVGIGTGNSRRVLESAADKFQARIEVIACVIEQRDESRRRQMWHVADNRGATVVDGKINFQKIRVSQPQDAHQFFADFGRHDGIFDDNIGFVAE